MGVICTQDEPEGRLQSHQTPSSRNGSLRIRPQRLVSGPCPFNHNHLAVCISNRFPSTRRNHCNAISPCLLRLLCRNAWLAQKRRKTCCAMISPPCPLSHTFLSRFLSVRSPYTPTALKPTRGISALGIVFLPGTFVSVGLGLARFRLSSNKNI